MIRLLNIYTQFVLNFMKANKIRTTTTNIIIMNTIIITFIAFLCLTIYIGLSIGLDIDKGGF